MSKLAVDGSGRTPVGHRAPCDIVVYTVIACVTWILVAPLAVAGVDMVDMAPPAWLHALGAVGPTVAAVAVLGFTGGRHAVVELWRRATDVRRIRGLWWVLTLSPLLLAAALVVVAPFGGVSAADGSALLAGAGMSVAYGIFEEVGWRGHLLPRLQARHQAMAAAGWVFVGVGRVAPADVCLPAARRVACSGLAGRAVLRQRVDGVLHNGTGGSVLACIVWHATYNLAATSGAQLSPLLAVAVTVLVMVGTLAAVRRVGVIDPCSGASRSTPADAASGRRPGRPAWPACDGR